VCLCAGSDSSVSEMEDEDDFKVQPSKDKKKSYEVEHESLEPDAIWATIRNESTRTIEMLSVDVRVVAFWS